MVMDFEQTQQLEQLKQQHKVQLLELEDTTAEKEHKRKIQRLEKLLEIARLKTDLKIEVV